MLTACSEDENVTISKENGGPELAHISATIGDLETRASNNSDYVGRKVFIGNDIMVLTKMSRTPQPLAAFSYENIRYKSNAEQAWDRDIMQGFYDKDRIYWTDNASAHTFIGYSTPQAWINADGTTKENKWVIQKKQSGTEGELQNTDFYYGQFSKSENNIVDFSASFTEAKPDVDEIGQNLKDEDILLAYNTNMHADVGGLTTTVHFKHALASLRVIIDINAFSPNSTSMDTQTTIFDMEVLNQPWKYMWKQTPSENGSQIPNNGWGVINNTKPEDGNVTIKAWQPRPNGEGEAQARIFTFYSLIVPSIQENFSIKYKVKYPNATNPTEYKEQSYKATVNEIKFFPGYCTTLRVSLNHEGEPVIIGAEYIDWENVETPDRSELQKVSTFLDITQRKDNSNKILVSIATDKVNNAPISKDDATWLYNDNNVIKDIYGNDGNSEATAYQIKSARQFLSFMYEVNEGKRSFKGKYIKLETGLYLQSSTTAGYKFGDDGTTAKVNDLDVSKLLIWPGIGTAETAFNGTFLGGVRMIKRLYGNPLFNNIGSKGHVEQLILEDVLGITNGGGAFAGKNNGVICAGKVASINTWAFSVTNTENYAGAFVGINNGVIMTCYSTGEFNSNTKYTGGLVGQNNGAIVGSYAANKASSTAADPVYGGIVASNSASTETRHIVYSFFCKDYWNQSINLADRNETSVKSMTTIEMQKEEFIGAQNTTDETTLNGAINTWSAAPTSWPSLIKEGLKDEQIKTLSDHFATRYYTFHVATFPWVH